MIRSLWFVHLLDCLVDGFSFEVFVVCGCNTVAQFS